MQAQLRALLTPTFEAAIADAVLGVIASGLQDAKAFFQDIEHDFAARLGVPHADCRRHLELMASDRLPELAEVRLTPTAAAVSTYVRPTANTGGVAGFLQALAPLSETLSKHADRLAQEEREAYEAAAERKIGGMTYEEARDAVKRGDMAEFSNPFFRASFEKQTGIRMGHEVRRRMEEALATEDLTDVDPDQWVSEFVRPANEEVDASGSKFMSAGFASNVSNLAEVARSKVNEDRIARTVEVRNDNAAQNFLGTIEWATGEAADEDALLTVVRQQYQQNRDLLGIPYADQDKIMGKVLQTIAQRPGMEKAVEALGKLDRDKVPLSTKLGPSFEAMKNTATAASQRAEVDAIQPDITGFIIAADAGELDEERFNAWVGQHGDVVPGTSVASIITRNKSAQEAKAAHALSQLQKTAKDAFLAGATPQLVDLARIGHVAEVRDLKGSVYGKDVEITQSEAKEHALSAAAAQIEAEGKAQGLDPVAIRQNVIRMYGQNGEVDPLVESRLSAFLNATVNPGDIPQTALNYLVEVQAARQVAPHMVDRVVSSEKDRLFLDTVLTGLDYGITSAEALKNAIYRRDNADKLTLLRGREQKRSVDAVVQWLDSYGSIFGFGGNIVRNRPEVENLIRTRLDYYYATGAQGSDLEKRVAGSIARTHTYLNGHLIDVTGTGLTATDALPVFEEAAKAVQEANPSHRTVTFIPLGRGSDRFKAVSVDGTPIAGTERSFAEMQALQTARRQARLATRGDAAKQKRELKKRLESMAES